MPREKKLKPARQNNEELKYSLTAATPRSNRRKKPNNARDTNEKSGILKFFAGILKKGGRR